MKISNITGNNFTAIYKVPNTTVQTHVEIQEAVAPLYEKYTKEPIYFFSGECPYDASVALIIDKDMKAKKLSYDWVVQNAKNYDINLPDPKNIDVWVITGKEDVEKITEYINKSEKITSPGFLKNLKRKLFGYERNYEIPEHLDVYTDMLEMREKLTRKFKEILKDKKVIEAKNCEDLYFKMVDNEICK